MVTIGSMGLLGNLLCILIFSRCATKLSQNSPKVVSKLCICCSEVVPVVSKLSRSCLQVAPNVSKLSRSCLQVVPVVSKLSQSNLNRLCILIFSRERAQKSFHHLMVFLAIFDLLYIIMALLLFGLPEIYNGCSLFSFSYSQVPFTKSLSGCKSIHVCKRVIVHRSKKLHYHGTSSPDKNTNILSS